MQLAMVCARLNCPHPYLAAANGGEPKEIWWFNAFGSTEERDGLELSYARNGPLMAALRPLSQRKEEFRLTFESTMTEYRADLSGGSVLRIAGTRYFAIRTTQAARAEQGAVFQAANGQQFVIASFPGLSPAERLAHKSPSGVIILAVQPQWSFPAESWIDADPEFWRGSPGAFAMQERRR